MVYYAHSGEKLDKSDWQLLKDHLDNVSELSGEFGCAFGCKELARIAGLFHDIGKYSDQFQKRLEGINISVNHSNAGARETSKIYGKLWGRILSYAIAGHHGGLPNGLDASPSCLRGRLISDIPKYNAFISEIDGFSDIDKIKPDLNIDENLVKFQIANMTRMVYSCLVDADFLDTEKVLDSERSKNRNKLIDMGRLECKFEMHMDKLLKNASDTYLNGYRNQIYCECRDAALKNMGMFTLTVPTGGGKTLSSMAFALKHAKLHGLKRIIYVIPYTSIIEQNADVFRRIFGKEAVLEHHSSYQFDDIVDKEDESISRLKKCMRLATENWDVSVIVTTNVQFFESLFSNKPSKCRKLHNIAESVIILDEVQMLPAEYLKPVVSMLGDMVMNYNSSIVLCTATQPVLTSYLPKGIKPVEIVKNPKELYKILNRVTIKNLGSLSDESLVERIKNEEQILCIVNTRKHARKIFDVIKEDTNTYHLSALMCPIHRRYALENIKKILKKGEICRVVSTQLIEAGVDIDFPIVYRASAGLDSIAQAAGRCNREGRYENGSVFVFEPEQIGMPAGWLSNMASVGRSVIRNLKDNEGILSLDTIERYFELLYGDNELLLDKKGILKEGLDSHQEFNYPFADIARRFKLIENDMVSIVVPYVAQGSQRGFDSEKYFDGLMNKLRFSEHKKRVLRELQPYTVQIYRHEFKKLLEAGALERPIEGVYALSQRNLYSLKTGLEIPNIEYRQGNELIF